MDFNFNNKLEEYYQKFIELQEKLKTSEEQRFMLEMKFNEMSQVAKEEEQAHYRKLRAQYKKFLEEDLKRQDRNERIIRNLERIEAKISMLAAKTERISMFRRQYQKYLRRIANNDTESKVPDAKISRERSFIKEESVKEQLPTLFRDDYSLPDRPKESINEQKPIYEHPAVKKSFEKDRSNEEKIEILDKYLQSISSQKCRDVLNQERSARDKLSLGKPLDKLLKDNLTLNSTNNATAVADDIMNSIYSRYYTKAEITPKENKVDLPISRSNEKFDNIKREFNEKNCLDSAFSKNEVSMVREDKPTVTFKEESNVSQTKNINNNATVGKALKDTGVNENLTDKHKYVQDQNKPRNLPIKTEFKQDTLKKGSQNNNKVEIGEYNNHNGMDTEFGKLTNGFETKIKQEAIEVKSAENKSKYENVINGAVKAYDNIKPQNEFKNIEAINYSVNNNHLEENKEEVYNSAGIVQNDMSPVLLREERNEDIIVTDDNYQDKTNFKQLSQEQVPEYDPNHQMNQNYYNPEEQEQLEYQSNEQPRQYNHNNQLSNEKSYHSEVPSSQQNIIERYQQHDDNKNQNNDNDQLAYDNQDQSPIQYLKDNESEQPIQYDLNSEQPIQYDPNNEQPLQYDLNSEQPIQYDLNNEQPIQYDLNSEQPIKYDLNNEQPIQYDLNSKPLYDHNQYEENVEPTELNPPNQSHMQHDENPTQPFDEPVPPTDYSENDPSYQQVQYNENVQPMPYDENGQPVGYDQYGQPLMYDQNGQIIQPQYDENGQFIPQYDENGQMIILYDHSGQQLFDNQYKGDQQYDLNGQPTVQYDENGQPIYDQSQQQYYNYPNQYQDNDQRQYTETQEEHLKDNIEGTINQHQTEQGNYYQDGKQEFDPNIEERPMEEIHQYVTGNQHQTEQGNYYQDGKQEFDPNKEERSMEEIHQYEASAEYNQVQDNTGEKQDTINGEEQNKVDSGGIEEKDNEIVKPTNVMDILDTDSESVKQNISKVSNDTDFDFS